MSALSREAKYPNTKPNYRHKPARALVGGTAFRLSVYFLIITITWLTLFLLRATAPSEIMDNDQQRPTSYALDLLLNGHYSVQWEDSGEIASKPPLQTWLVGLCVLVLGELDEFALALPGALSALISALLMMAFGWRYFGDRVAIVAPLLYLFCMPTVRQLYYFRTDGVLALLLFAAVLVAILCVQGYRLWLLFWALIALASLTKGPHLALLPLGALVALPFMRGLTKKNQDDEGLKLHYPPLRDTFLGVLLLLLVTIIWFALAWFSAGQPLIDKMIGKELVGHLSSGKNSTLWAPTVTLFSQLAPWSLLIFPYLFSVFRNKNDNPTGRMAELMLLSYVIVMIVILSLAGHQRHIHQLPLVAAAMLLLGKELCRWIRVPLGLGGLTIWMGLLLGISGGFFVYYHVLRPYDKDVRRSAITLNFAEELKAKVGTPFPFVYTAAPVPLQLVQGTFLAQTSLDVAAKALRSTKPVFVITREREELERMMIVSPEKFHVLAESASQDAAPLPWYVKWIIWQRPTKTETGKPFLTLLSNQPQLAPTQSIRTFCGTVRVDAFDVSFTKLTSERLAVTLNSSTSTLSLQNFGSESVTMRIALTVGAKTRHEKVSLTPGSSREFGWLDVE